MRWSESHTHVHTQMCPQMHRVVLTHTSHTKKENLHRTHFWGVFILCHVVWPEHIVHYAVSFLGRVFLLCLFLDEFVTCSLVQICLSVSDFILLPCFPKVTCSLRTLCLWVSVCGKCECLSDVSCERVVLWWCFVHAVFPFRLQDKHGVKRCLTLTLFNTDVILECCVYHVYIPANHVFDTGRQTHKFAMHKRW